VGGNRINQATQSNTPYDRSFMIPIGLRMGTDMTPSSPSTRLLGGVSPREVGFFVVEASVFNWIHVVPGYIFRINERGMPRKSTGQMGVGADVHIWQLRVTLLGGRYGKCGHSAAA
jgi:hypothetical protein